jgi:hypothetical protein
MKGELADWHKSSYSGAQADCVEVGRAPEIVGVRDSKNREGDVLVFPQERWADFVDGLRRSG